MILVTQENEEGGPQCQGLPGLESRFEASLGNLMRVNHRAEVESWDSIQRRTHLSGRGLLSTCKALDSIPKTM